MAATCCSRAAALHIAPQVVIALPVVGGRADRSLGVPPVAALVGVQLHLQAAVPDPAANSAGTVVSNAVMAAVGAR